MLSRVGLIALDEHAGILAPAHVEAQGRPQVAELEVVVAAAGVVQQGDGGHVNRLAVYLDGLGAAGVGPVAGIGGGHLSAVGLIGPAGHGDGLGGVVVAHRELSLGAIEHIGHVPELDVVGAVAVFVHQSVHLELHRLAVHGDRLGAGHRRAAGRDGLGGRSGGLGVGGLLRLTGGRSVIHL